MKDQLIYPHTPYVFYLPNVLQTCRLDEFDFTGQTFIAKILKHFLSNVDSTGIYFYGWFGVGKSHLMTSLYRIRVAQEEDASPSFLRFETFENIVKETLTKNETEKDEYFNELLDTEDLFIDDITTLLPKHTEVLRRIINGRYESQKRVCFTSNKTLKELFEENLLHPHAISRLKGMCEIVEVKGNDRRGKKREIDK